MEEVYKDVMIEKISRRDEDYKTGKKFFTKKGNPYHRLGLQIVGGEGEWRNGVDWDNSTADWEKGMVVKVRLFEEEYQGKVYKKFELPKQANMIDIMEKSLNELAVGKDVKTNDPSGTPPPDWTDMGGDESGL